MDVLMTADAVGGVWSHALDLIDGLADLDVAVTLAVTGAPLSAAQRAQLRRSPVARCFAADFALEWMPDPWRDVARTNDWLLEIERMTEPDVVHLNSYAAGAAGFEAPVLVAAHSCVCSWFEAVRGHPAPPAWDRYRTVVAAGLRAAELLVAPTRVMLEAVRLHYAAGAPAEVIPNGVAPAPASLQKDDVVLGAGRLWDEAKNVAALNRVAARVPWPVEVAGESPAGETHHLRLLGRLDRAELRRRMGSARVFCAPARYEPFGLAPLEAASAGCALVLGDIPSLREVWGDAALYAPPDDDVAIASAVERAMHDPELGERAGARANGFTRNRMAAAYADAYERVVTHSYEGEAVRVNS